MKCLVILSHLMSNTCELSSESIARCNLAFKLWSKEKFEFIVTLGWAYRKDCETPISDAVKTYILKNSQIKSESVISISSSRDTVGDAYYSLIFLKNSFA